MGRRAASQIPAEQVEALTAAGGALVRLASESLAEVDARVSLIQLRALIALSEFGTMRAVDMAARLAVSDSSVTRLCDRLVADGLILRELNPDSRREVLLSATPDGRRLVHRALDRRRHDRSRVLAGLGAAQRDAAPAALSKFAALAAGPPSVPDSRADGPGSGSSGGHGPSRSAHASRPVEELATASEALMRLAAQSLTEVDARVSLSQFRALLALSEFGTMRATDLRVRIGASTASVTRLCNRLVAEGLIRRELNPDNRREVHLTATPDGRRLVHRIIDRRRHDVGRVLAGLEEAERDAASAALSRFTTRAAGLQEADGHAAIDSLRKFAYLAAD